MKNKIFVITCAIIMAFSTGCGKNSEETFDKDLAVAETNVSITGNEVIDKATEILSDENEMFLKVKEIVDDMTLEEKVGQLFFVRFPDVGVIEEIEQYSPGGYIVFGRDFENSNPDEFRKMIDDCQNNSNIPLLIGVDEEGGSVVRASKYKQFREESFKSQRQLYEEGGLDSVVTDAKEKSQFLKTLGINVNLAPVCDISTNSENFIYERSVGLNPEETSKYTVAVQEAMKENGMGSVLKHFPGYGDNMDTHTGESRDTRDLEYLTQNDLVPFKEAIENGCDAILVSHNIIEAIDSENPATLSYDVHNFLRKDMGFDGVIVTDDMAMGALENFDVSDAAVQSVLAGNDLIITSDIATQYNAVLEALKSGEIGDNRVDDAVCKVIFWKLKLGLIE